jgi:hypothetical protein
MTELMGRLEKVAQATYGKEDLMGRLEKVANGVFDEQAYRDGMQEARDSQAVPVAAVNSLIGAGIGGFGGKALGYNPLVGAGVGAVASGLGSYLGNRAGNAIAPAVDEMMINQVKAQGGVDEAGGPTGEFNAENYQTLKDGQRSLASKISPALYGGMGAVGGGVVGNGLAKANPALGAVGHAVGTAGGALAGLGAGALAGAGLQGAANYFDKRQDEKMINAAEEGAEEETSPQGARSVSNAPAGEDKTASELMDHLEKTAEEFFFKKKEDKKDENCDENCKDDKKDVKKDEKKDDKEAEKEASELMDRLEKVAAGLKIPSPSGMKDAAMGFKNDLAGKTTRTAKTQAQNQLKAVGAGAAGATAIGAGIKALSNKDSNKGETQEKQASTQAVMNGLYKEAAHEILNQPMEKVAKYNDPMNRIRFDR